LKNWNKIGWIKTGVVASSTILPFFSSIEPSEALGLMLLFLFFCFSIILPILSTSSFWDFLAPNMTIQNPRWNDTISAYRPLSAFQFIAIWFIGFSIGAFFSTLIEFQTINTSSLVGILIGLGLLLGVKIKIKMKK
jgi:hypothetical protein